jgi:pyruvate formate lyase activating enzyme
MRTLLVSSLQRYSLHDGPGIRTTIFFAGCPLDCLWCHNPECIPSEATLLFRAEKCGGCGACVECCPAGAVGLDEQQKMHFNRSLCTACGFCVERCPVAARELSARPYSPEELVKILMRDRPFFVESGGGITLSGGEVMAQDAEGIGELLQLLKDQGIAVNIDTCGYTPWDRFQAALPLTDTFLYDLKAFDSALHERLTGRDNRFILRNLKHLSDAGAKISLRIPVIGGANDDPADWEVAAGWLRQNVRVNAVHLLPYHNTGAYKYARLGKDAHTFFVPTPETMQSIQALFIEQGFDAPLIGG